MTGTSAAAGGNHRSGPYDVALGARIRERRLSLGITQQNLARAIGITYQQEHKYEKGINRITVARLRDMAAALGTTVAVLAEEVEGVELITDQHEVLDLVQSYRAMPGNFRAAYRSLGRVLANR